MGQGLVYALPPAFRPYVEPELHIHSTVSHQKRVSGRNENRIIRDRPRRQIKRAQCTALHQFNVGAANLNLPGNPRTGRFSGKWGCRPGPATASLHASADRTGLLPHRPTEVARRSGELIGHPGSLRPVMESKPGLAQQFAKDAGKEPVEGREFAFRPVVGQPTAQPFVAFTRCERYPLLHVSP